MGEVDYAARAQKQCVNQDSESGKALLLKWCLSWDLYYERQLLPQMKGAKLSGQTEYWAMAQGGKDKVVLQKPGEEFERKEKENYSRKYMWNHIVSFGIIHRTNGKP